MSNWDLNYYLNYFTCLYNWTGLCIVSINFLTFFYESIFSNTIYPFSSKDCGLHFDEFNKLAKYFLIQAKINPNIALYPRVLELEPQWKNIININNPWCQYKNITCMEAYYIIQDSINNNDKINFYYSHDFKKILWTSAHIPESYTGNQIWIERHNNVITQYTINSKNLFKVYYKTLIC